MHGARWLPRRSHRERPAMARYKKMRIFLPVVMNQLHCNQGQFSVFSPVPGGCWWVPGGMAVSIYIDGRARRRVVKTIRVSAPVPETAGQHLSYSHDPKSAYHGLEIQTTISPNKPQTCRHPCKDSILLSHYPNILSPCTYSRLSPLFPSSIYTPSFLSLSLYSMDASSFWCLQRESRYVFR